MFSLIRKIFSTIPEEAKQALNELDNIEQELTVNLAYSEVKKIVGKMISQSPLRVISTMNESNVTPRGVAFILIMNVAGDMAMSGHYHIYRGSLNMVGQDLIKIWDYAAKELLEMKLHTQEEVNSEKNKIMAEIKAMG